MHEWQNILLEHFEINKVTHLHSIGNKRKKRNRQVNILQDVCNRLKIILKKQDE